MNRELHMNISDERLSAFLDAELPEAEMEAIRQALADNEQLAERLAELAMVDELVALSAAKIDTQPIPEQVNVLLESSAPSATVIQFPFAQRARQLVRNNLAIAASVMLVMAVGAFQLLASGERPNHWQAVAQVLETAPSGHQQRASDGSQIRARLSFINREGDYCRQFQLQDRAGNSEQIACRHEGEWRQLASAPVKASAPGSYQTASGDSPLDATLDDMISGEPLDATAEAAAIANRWAR
jgi:hypothetical protein